MSSKRTPNLKSVSSSLLKPRDLKNPNSHFSTPSPTLLSPSPSPPSHFLSLLRSHLPALSSPITPQSLLHFFRRRLLHYPTLSPYDLHLFLQAPPEVSHHHSVFLFLVRSLSRSHRLEPLLPLLTSLPASPCPCSTSSIFSCPHLPLIHHIAISAFLGAARFDDAVVTFNSLKKLIDGRVDVSIYNAMISGFAKRREHQKAVEWYEKMVADKVTPDVVTFNILVSSSMRIGEFEMGLGWLKEMKRKGIEPNVVSFNTILRGFLREGRFKEGIGVAREMVEIGCGLSVATCEILVGGFCRGGRGLEVCEILMGFLERGVVPDGFDCSGLVGALCTDGEVERGMEVVRKFWENGMRVNVVSCIALMEGLRSLGKIDETVKFMERMIEKEMVPDRITCNCLLEDLCNGGRTVEANRLRVLASKKGFEPDNVTFGILIRGFSGEGRRKEGAKVVDEMFDANLIPNIATYNQLMDGLLCRRKWHSRDKLNEKKAD